LCLVLRFKFLLVHNVTEYHMSYKSTYSSITIVDFMRTMRLNNSEGICSLLRETKQTLNPPTTILYNYCNIKFWPNKYHFQPYIQSCPNYSIPISLLTGLVTLVSISVYPGFLKVESWGQFFSLHIFRHYKGNLVLPRCLISYICGWHNTLYILCPMCCYQFKSRPWGMCDWSVKLAAPALHAAQSCKIRGYANWFSCTA